MWLFGKQSVRRKEIRRSKAERGLTWYSRLSERIHARPLASVCIFGLLAAVLVNVGGDVLDVRNGQVLARAATARVDFRVEDKARTIQMRERARDNAPNYYLLDHSLLQDVRGRLTSAVRIAREHTDDPDRLKEEAARNKLALDDAAVTELIRLAEAPESREFQNAVDRAMSEMPRQPLVEANELSSGRTAVTAVLVDPETEKAQNLAVSKLLYSSNREAAEVVASVAAREFPPALRPSMRGALTQMLREEDERQCRPLYRYDKARSTEVAEAAAKAVPEQYVEYARDARLVESGPISRPELELLKAEHAAYLASLGTDGARFEAYRLAQIGRGMLAFLVVVGGGGYLARYRIETLRSPLRAFATAAALLALLAGARLTFVYSGMPQAALGFQTFAAALLAIIYPGGAVFAVGSVMALLMTIATQQGAGFFMTLLVTSMTMLFGLREIRYRGRIVGVGAIAAVAALLTTLMTGLGDGQSLVFAFWQQGVWAALLTLAAAFLVDGILPALERLFGVCTSMTLLEWCDASKPLLRLLATEAPGTYNHSLMVGTLAQAGAEAIGANALLARTGAYYHDIGKINKPEYFVENQAMGMQSRHERLSPAMSLLIIIGHVKDGVEMAKEYALPNALRPFIAEHHGTTLVEYFYYAASRARKPDEPEVAETEFRYPGPKPQSRETAIVMLADGVEGAVRAMSEPTPARIEDTVRKLAQKRLLDGQFDECDLTFRELETVTRTVIKSLNSIYHARIAYPEAEEEEPAPAEARNAS